MTELRFDGQVAVVTGAGGNPGLGRTYSMFLASRGAKVLVNDLGVGPDGRGTLVARADAVAREIQAAGGEALADLNSVAEQASAQAIVDAAIEAWGRIDILVNNAGVAPMALFSEFSAEDVVRTISVHLMGNLWMCKAVWPHMEKAGYGRIVNITSAAVNGGRYLSLYAAAKGGIMSMTRSLAIEGIPVGIKANSVGPTAGTVATRVLTDDDAFIEMMAREFPPELVAPAVAVLAHERCPVTGLYLEVSGGRVAERYFCEATGYVDQQLTPETLIQNFEAVTDRGDAHELPTPLELAEQNQFDFKPPPYSPT
jgi:NAD(P)-dependent dehydrogenase (short-subunit alcohol dehydrogenase family)